MPRHEMRGSYGNDCPHCQHHNAILRNGQAYQCRDCGRWFYIDLHSARAPAWHDMKDPHITTRESI
jgi:transposase-like protein